MQTAAVEAGDTDSAARHFIDFWMGAGAWDRTPEQRKGPIAASVANVRGWGDALFNETTPLEAFSALDVPVLYMVGERSPASSRSVARLLTRVLPRVEVIEFEGLGHMGPVTHPAVVNAAIDRFLARRVEFMSAVTLFSDAQFAGWAVSLDEGHTRFTTDFNDVATSIRVAPGYVAMLFEHANEFSGYGASVDLLEDCPDLSVYGFDKKTSYVHDLSSPARGLRVGARCDT